MRARLALGAVIAAGALAGCTAASAGDAARPAAAPELLPDLAQEAPSDLQVARVPGAPGRWRLGFASAVTNVGAGPIIVRGRRAGAPERMAVTQIIRRTDGTSVTVPRVGTMRYVTAADHAHWHLLGFERYELRGLPDQGLRARDRKTGFCLGDRYDARRRLAAQPPRPVYTSRCGLRARGLRAVVQGISVGYGDDYEAFLEGQHVEITGLPAGRYRLVHRVNVDRRLREESHANNSASVALTLSWHGGVPRILTRR